jgi:predicted aminopeptidase
MRTMLTDVRTWAVIAACLALPGCYVMQAARGQLAIVRAREPIDRVVQDPQAPEELRGRLRTVQEARAFASRELGLPDNRSYTTYAHLDREFVVWNVVAAPEFSVDPVEWCFPFVGCVAYRGYFQQAAADRFAAKLSGEGLDTVVDGVPAYSTLGKFDDPILSTMLGYGDDELAAIIFHELAHQLIYVPGDSSFNEAFAVSVEEEGLARWLSAHGRAADLQLHLARRERQAQRMRVIERYRDQLKSLYASGLQPAALRARKSEVFAHLVSELRALDTRDGVRSTLVGELDGAPNNARLASLATYYDCVPGFERELASAGDDLPRFYAAVREIAKLPTGRRHARLCAQP